MKLAIMFCPNKKKASPKTGKIPVYVRLTLNREKAESRLNIEIHPKEVLMWDGKLMRFTDRSMSANIFSISIFDSFESIEQTGNDLQIELERLYHELDKKGCIFNDDNYWRCITLIGRSLQDENSLSVSQLLN